MVSGRGREYVGSREPEGEERGGVREISRAKLDNASRGRYVRGRNVARRYVVTWIDRTGRDARNWRRATLVIHAPEHRVRDLRRYSTRRSDNALLSLPLVANGIWPIAAIGNHR